MSLPLPALASHYPHPCLPPPCLTLGDYFSPKKTRKLLYSPASKLWRVVTAASDVYHPSAKYSPRSNLLLRLQRLSQLQPITTELSQLPPTLSPSRPRRPSPAHNPPFTHNPPSALNPPSVPASPTHLHSFPPETGKSQWLSISVSFRLISPLRKSQCLCISVSLRLISALIRPMAIYFGLS